MALRGLLLLQLWNVLRHWNVKVDLDPVGDCFVVVDRPEVLLMSKKPQWRASMDKDNKVGNAIAIVVVIWFLGILIFGSLIDFAERLRH